MNRLDQKVCVVTGAGSGLGEAIARRFAAEGGIVVLTDINSVAVEQVAQSIRDQGGAAEAIVQDVTDEAQWESVMSTVQARHAALHVLVNNAGIGILGTVEDCTLEDWRRTHAVNLDAVFMGTRAAVKLMKTGQGSIINMSSIEGFVGDREMAAYNSTKGAVRLLTKSAALHCANEGYRVRVNSIHPGFIETPLVVDTVSRMSEEAAADFQARTLGMIPMGELGQPEDIAHAAVFLASDESRYMTGSELVIDGGYTAR